MSQLTVYGQFQLKMCTYHLGVYSLWSRNLSSVFSGWHVPLSVHEAESEDDDVAYERTRVSSGDVGDDVLVLQELTKVRCFASWNSFSSPWWDDFFFFNVLAGTSPDCAQHTSKHFYHWKSLSLLYIHIYIHLSQMLFSHLFIGLPFHLVSLAFTCRTEYG